MRRRGLITLGSFLVLMSLWVHHQVDTVPQIAPPVQPVVWTPVPTPPSRMPLQYRIEARLTDNRPQMYTDKLSGMVVTTRDCPATGIYRNATVEWDRGGGTVRFSDDGTVCIVTQITEK
jgi:hypothetical protein